MRMRLTGELIVPAGLILFSAAYVADTARITLLGRLFPWSILAFMTIGCAVLAVAALVGRPLEAATPGREEAPPGPVLTFVALVVALVVAAQFVGLLAAGLVFVMLASRLLGASLRLAVASAVLLYVTCYLVFTLALGQRL